MVNKYSNYSVPWYILKSTSTNHVPHGLNVSCNFTHDFSPGEELHVQQVCVDTYTDYNESDLSVVSCCYLSNITNLQHYRSVRLYEEVTASLSVGSDIIRSVAVHITVRSRWPVGGLHHVCVYLWTAGTCLGAQRQASARKGIFAHQCTGRETEPVCPHLSSLAG